MATALASGKLILFGEHFVVYGLPAIATAIEARTVAEVHRADSYSLQDNRPETPGYKEEKREQQEDSIQRILKATGLDGENLRIVLGGDLVAASGIGASGASCVTIAAALNEEFNLGLDRNAINEIAYEGEKGYHGTPSGIDNSCSTFGGFIWFEKGIEEAQTVIKPINSKLSLSIIIGNTGITSNTSKIVEEVKKEREKNPERFREIFEEYNKFVTEAETALKAADLKGIGRLMNANHALLKEIGVSSEELEKLVEIALSNGALGAKLTGTGRGGLMIALVAEEDDKARVASAINNAGFEAEITRMGAEGVRIEHDIKL